MYGVRLPQIVKECFARVDLNQLEKMLLDKYLLTAADPKMPENIAKLAKNILE